MIKHLSLVLAMAVAVVAASVSAQSPPAAPASDIDAFMREVLSRRDDNWKKLRQYTLDEDEIFQISALNGRKVYGFKREYTWYPNDDGIFVRSPISADGVRVSESDRRKAEADWIAREQRRTAETPNSTTPDSQPQDPANSRRQDPAHSQRADGTLSQGTGTAASVESTGGGTHVSVDTDEPPPSLDDIVKPNAVPRFVSSAYFMKFRFDEGSYAFAGRERLLGREVYRIEYYPHQLFRDSPEKRERDRERRKARGEDPDKDLDDRIERKMDKVSMVTLWIEPKEHQILQYEFSNIDFDFLPARSLVRLDQIRASMRMREAFPQVWLPDTINMSFGITLALGDVGARYEVKYYDYKLAEVKAKVRIP